MGKSDQNIHRSQQKLESLQHGSMLSSPTEETLSFSRGVPTLLIPINDDWAPTSRDTFAPHVLPSRTLMGKVRTVFQYRAGKPFRALPKSLLRPAPPPLSEGPTYSPFLPFYIPGRHAKQVANGFEPRYPASIMLDHDISAVDWDRFLVSLRVTGALRVHDHLVANLAPSPLFVLGAGYGNYFITRGIMSALQKRYIADVLAMVEMYQYFFFGPRHLDVFVACGTYRLTGYYPGDDSYMDATSVETGLWVDGPCDFDDESSDSDSSDSDLEELLRRVPRKQRKTIRAKKQASTPPSKKDLQKMEPSMRYRAMEFKSQEKRRKLEFLSRRRRELQEEENMGYCVKKHGKYRIIVSPLRTRVPLHPTPEALANMRKLLRKWGCSDTGLLLETV